MVNLDTQESKTVVPKWDQFFLEKARHTSTMSKDNSTQVGSVISDGKIHISEGYNGFPQGVDDSPELYADRDNKLAKVLHSEENSILFARRDLTGCTIYVYPMAPCAHCASMIAQVGITRVVTLRPTAEQEERWGKHFRYARETFEQKGIEVTYYNMSDVFPPQPKLCICPTKE